MNQSLTTFDFNETPVRVVERDGEPWFVAADVCRVLEHTNPTMAVQSLDEDDLSNIEVIDSLGRKQTANTVNESGLYQLVFSSRKPEARTFKRWVTKEVLPAIRKTGRYVAADVVDCGPVAAAVQALQGNAAAAERARDLVLSGQIALETAQVIANLCSEVRSSWTMRMKIAPLPMPEALEPDEIRALVCRAAGGMEQSGDLTLTQLCGGEVESPKSVGCKLASLRGLLLIDPRGRRFIFSRRRTRTGAVYSIDFTGTEGEV
jgi:prophage antirepressor-like protein